MRQSLNTVDVWENEYREIQNIPSSNRPTPSKALCILASLIDFSNIKHVLDAGCGNGRNSIYMAKLGCKVTAADFSTMALDAANVAADSELVRQDIAIQQVDLFRTLPYPNSQFDLCLDSYVSCHFVDEEKFQAYWDELSRVTRPEGLIFSSMFCKDDEFYAQFKKSAPKYELAIDPTNGIAKVLYSEDQFKLLFRPPLRIKYFLKFQFTDTVLGKQYLRSLLVALLQKTE
jgi:SAM-dependent methyltransferase